ncbi:MAG: GIY-YIG nuclease family protein [Methanobrevibacter sp.]|jgi:Uri superfamily endonuclease|nr:GIY-YIG nuclease family protein [Candidatus Methanoflexus mossambicus]
MIKKKVLKGLYCLIIFNNEDKCLKIGSLKHIFFKKGYYVYIGSAMNSLIARLKRHLSKDKKKHWHVDYFLSSKNVEIEEIFYYVGEKRLECEIAKLINGKEINSFGCSDCNCNSHLKYFNNYEDCIKSVQKAFIDLNIEYYDLNDYNNYINQN